MAYYFDSLDNIHVEPYVGRDYYNTFEGKRILCIGNSYFAGIVGGQELAFKDFISVFAHPHNELHSIDFWEFIASFLCRDYQGEDHKDLAATIKQAFQESYDNGIWDKLAFYSFFQSGIKVGISDFFSDLTERLSIDREAAFMEVLEKLAPDIIMMVDLDLYRDLPEFGQPGQSFRLSGGEEVLTWEFFLNNGHLVRLHYVPAAALKSPCKTLQEIVQRDSGQPISSKKSIADYVDKHELDRVIEAFQNKGYIDCIDGHLEWGKKQFDKSDFIFWMMEVCHYFKWDREPKNWDGSGIPKVPYELFLSLVRLAKDPNWKADAIKKNTINVRRAVFGQYIWSMGAEKIAAMSRKEKEEEIPKHAKEYLARYDEGRHHYGLPKHYQSIVNIFDHL